MKKIKLLSIAIPIALVLLFITGFKPKGGNPSANGGGTSMELGEKSTFSFNAIQHNDGSVNGHFVYQFRGGDLSIHMEIDCMTFFGNKATLSGTVSSVSGNTDAYPFIAVGGRASFSVEDNGQGSKAANPDKISDVFFGASCAGNYVTYIPISGNVSVNP